MPHFDNDIEIFRIFFSKYYILSHKTGSISNLAMYTQCSYIWYDFNMIKDPMPQSGRKFHRTIAFDAKDKPQHILRRKEREKNQIEYIMANKWDISSVCINDVFGSH